MFSDDDDDVDISEEFNIELGDDDETTESSDSESFSSELAEAIKGVEEELSSVGDIEVEDISDEEITPKPSASSEVTSTTESEDEELDILEAVEELAEEVSGTDTEKDEPPPQIGVAMNGEPRSNTTEGPLKSPKTVLKRTHRVSRHQA